LLRWTTPDPVRMNPGIGQEPDVHVE
jgi:hypothetical protein